MSIKTKLMIIVFAIILLPPLSVALQFFFQNNTAESSPGQLVSSIRILSAFLPGAVKKKDYSALAVLPAGASLIVRDDSGEILYATKGAVGMDAGVDDGKDYHFFRFTSGNIRVTAELSVSKALLDARFPRFTGVAITLALLVLVLIFLPILLLRSLDKSIRTLEKATVKIASGDLDFPPSELKTTDLAPLGLSLDLMRRQLKEDRARRDRFIMGVSHDLKTPLAVISGYLDALREGLADTDEKRDAYFAIMAAKTDLLGQRIAHLIELARTTTNDWQKNLSESDLVSFLEETFLPLGDYCSIHGYVLEKNINLVSPLLLKIDRDMIARVFENLIANAVSYGDTSSPVRVSASPCPDTSAIEIRVENGGKGIPAEDVPKIFEPFFRGDKGRNDGGFGLGLASVKSIIETHGWTITVQSVPGSRTVFALTIPVTAAIPQAPAGQTPSGQA
jgi:signal transduction histidine kinase